MQEPSLAKPILLRFKREPIVLSCSKCDLTLRTMGYPDPLLGEGWPKHRCQRFLVRSFDQCKPDTIPPAK